LQLQITFFYSPMRFKRSLKARTGIKKRRRSPSLFYLQQRAVWDYPNPGPSFCAHCNKKKKAFAFTFLFAAKGCLGF
jgi:hypothetical protein